MPALGVAASLRWTSGDPKRGGYGVEKLGFRAFGVLYKAFLKTVRLEYNVGFSYSSTPNMG